MVSLSPSEFTCDREKPDAKRLKIPYGHSVHTLMSSAEWMSLKGRGPRWFTVRKTTCFLKTPRVRVVGPLARCTLIQTSAKRSIPPSVHHLFRSEWPKSKSYPLVIWECCMHVSLCVLVIHLASFLLLRDFRAQLQQKPGGRILLREGSFSFVED